ncbi:MAG TPA: sigma-54 dependent transcriptional regulator [Deltaproteobacteria bacterium]|nr:sigma-54 dependent transcriptional regulator [Deltaproteobacteria bacterium]HPR54347.1 sigma-54 dependent transcriptional regulator [Deltaproteobacteria bacterium]HXK47014.1 sigma-54 dependent transcriptional regulator [Deltaproteobacteria bacterium]
MEETKKILLVDDEEVFLEQLKDALEQSSLELQIDTACDGLDALEKIEANRHDIVITDIKMPRMDGYALLREIHDRYPTTYVVVVTAFGSISGAVEAMKYGAYDFLEKPFNMDTLEISLTKILRQHEILKENIELKGQIQQHTEGLDQLVGSHPKMQRLYEQILTAAETDLTVLILGETGTGKELIARSIHSRSDRRAKPFVVINCAAIPENLLESEFFGHEKGAFSGAVSLRIGKFEKAHTGTIFLDEIGDIPLDLQAKILRVLEDHKITRLGSNREIDLDFRVICATNRPIQDMIRKELFREDLYYRISVLPIIVPPIRERREDISLLAGHFIAKYAQKLNSTVRGLSPRAMDQLETYPWPGNVREMENIIQHAMVSTRSELITDFPELGRTLSEASPPAAASIPDEPAILVDAGEGNDYHAIKKALLEQFERKYFAHLLEKHGGVIAEAARESGLNYKTFYLKVEKYRLTKKRERTA